MTRSMSVPCQMPSHTKADLCSPLETHVCTRRKATFLPAFPSVFYGRHLFFLFCFAYTKAMDSSPHTSSGLLFSLLSVKYLKLNATFLVFHSSSLPLLTLSFSSSLKLQKRQSIYIFSLNRFPFETESQSNLLSLDPSGLRQAGRKMRSTVWFSCVFGRALLAPPTVVLLSTTHMPDPHSSVYYISQLCS